MVPQPTTAAVAPSSKCASSMPWMATDAGSKNAPSRSGTSSPRNTTFFSGNVTYSAMLPWEREPTKP